MYMKLHWGVVTCVLVMIGCQSEAPNMRLLTSPILPPAAPVAQSGIAEDQAVIASHRAEPTRPAAAAGTVAGYPSFTQPATPARTPVTKADVINWSSRGVSDDVIIDRITRSKTIFPLTAADQNELRDKGVSKPVIQAMREMWRR